MTRYVLIHCDLCGAEFKDIVGQRPESWTFKVEVRSSKGYATLVDSIEACEECMKKRRWFNFWTAEPREQHTAKDATVAERLEEIINEMVDIALEQRQ